MPTAVVTGANHGVGHEFAKKLINEGYTVYATDVQVGEGLNNLNTPHKHHLDVSSPSSISDFTRDFGDQPLDLLLNVAGVFPGRAADSLESVTHDILTRTFQINTFGPLLLTQALLPTLLLSATSSTKTTRLPPLIANVSSRVGSISDNTSGGTYAYRSSKAALNSISKSMAVDLKETGIGVIVLHPGIVKTGMDPDDWKVEGAVAPEVAVEGLWEVVKRKGADLEETGKFWHRDGYELPW